MKAFLSLARHLAETGLNTRTRPWTRRMVTLSVLALGFQTGAILAAESANAYRGLWVGEVSLNFANEVSVPLGADNAPVAPDPTLPTPTRDQANLRLILHVNGSGQVTLLKQVAVSNRLGTTNAVRADSDVALVTDETLYGEFPPQPALRLATAAFDFGDSKATEAVDAVVEAVTLAVSASVQSASGLDTPAGRTAAINAAAQAGSAKGAEVIASADAASAFTSFLSSTNLDASAMDQIASSNAAVRQAALNRALVAANHLLTNSFYRDTRGLEMVWAVSNAVSSAAGGTERTNAAQNTAASFCDVERQYDRFIAGKSMGDLIVAAAASAASVAVSNGATQVDIESAVGANSTVNDVLAEALRIKVTAYRDTRGTTATDGVLNAVITNAASFLSASTRNLEVIRSSAEDAGRKFLAAGVLRYAGASQGPTPNYNSFVLSDAYKGSANTASQAAAQAAVEERSGNTLYNITSLEREARLAAVEALESLYSSAALAVRNELPMTGRFGPGIGDPRLTWQVWQTNRPVTLSDPALITSIHLPASHPTNPFRHRRHPDHTRGYDITRHVRLDFDGVPGAALSRPGYGVERITGVYREEIFGLHKPLGPQSNIGLRVEGTFRLDRISLIDTLNAR